MKVRWMTTLENQFGDAFAMNYPLAPHTTFKIGGAAQGFLVVTSETQLVSALTTLLEENVPFLVLGKGANLIFSDSGFKGLVIQLKGEFEEIKITHHDEENVFLEAGAGVEMSRLLNYTARAGFKGLEPLTGIPATVGGAIRMNAGIPSFTISEALTSVVCLTHTLSTVRIGIQDLSPSYRSLNLPDRWIILRATFKLRKGSPETVRKEMEAYRNKRTSQRWRKFPSAGSIFKNPKGKYAGQLIESCGFKGYKIGDAQVSPDHANVIVNLGNARAKDVLRLIDLIQKRVFEKTGIHLEPEVVIAEEG